mgnify:CR=1 FL=1
MFKVFANNDGYENKCAKVFNEYSKIDLIVILAYIEDFKGIFDAIEKETKEPEIILINAGNLILKSILNNTLSEIREGNKCRMHEQITLKINTWAYEILNEGNDLKEKIKENLNKYKEMDL